MSTQPPQFSPDPHRRRRAVSSQEPVRRSITGKGIPRPEEPSKAATPPPSFAPSRLRRNIQEPPQSEQPHASTPAIPQMPAPVIPPRQSRLHRQTQTHPHNSPQPTPQSIPRNAPHQARIQPRPQAGPQWHTPRPAALARKKKRHKARWLALVTIPLIVALIAWPMFLFTDANNNLQRIRALSGATDTPGTTYLLAGSDSRDDGPIHDDTEGQRSDSLMLVHVAPNGQSSAISLPRDTWVTIPDNGDNKLNASYAIGGPELLVQTVEELTGLTVDHYIEIGMGGVGKIVDAVGGVELCMDYDVNDELSELNWTAGCHVSDGRTALAFARMRYSDPQGDIGRAERQRQVVTKTIKTALSPAVLLPPSSALALERAGASALRVDSDTQAWDILQMIRAFRSAGHNGLTGAPPIESVNYETYAGSAVLLQDETAPSFFAKLRQGHLSIADLAQKPE